MTASPLPQNPSDLGRLAAIAVVVPIMLIALLGPLLTWQFGLEASSPVGTPSAAPNAQYPLGTDALGRDVVARVLDGGMPVVAASIGAAVLAEMLAHVRRLSPSAGKAINSVALGGGFAMLLVLAAGVFRNSGLLVVMVALFSVAMLDGTRGQSSAGGGGVTGVETNSTSLARSRRDPLDALLDNAPTVFAQVCARFVPALVLTSILGILGFLDQPNWAAMAAENLACSAVTPWPLVVPALLLIVLGISARVLGFIRPLTATGSTGGIVVDGN